MNGPDGVCLTVIFVALITFSAIAVLLLKIPFAEAATITITTNRIQDLHVNEGDTVVIEPNTHLLSGLIVNHGTIVVNGSMEVYANLTNLGTIVDNGAIDAYGFALNEGGIIKVNGNLTFNGPFYPGFVNRNEGKITISDDGRFDFVRSGSYVDHGLINEQGSMIDNFGSIAQVARAEYVIQNNGSIYKECGGTFTISVTGIPLIDKCKIPTQNSTLSILTADLNKKPVSGLWASIRSTNGTLLDSGFTPLSFTGESGAEYIVSLANYDGKMFSRWQDNNSTTNTRTVPLISNTTLTAIYDTGDSLRGVAPLTFTGTPEQPDLTINSVSTGDNKTLHMWTIIDPQSTNSSGTTYKVYATNGYQNLVFDHWGDNGSKNSIRFLTISQPTNITAFFREESVNTVEHRNGNILVKVEPLDYTTPGNSIFLVSPNGTRMGTGCSDCQSVVFSPDNARLAYGTISKGYPADIFVANVNNNATTNLTNHPLADGFPSWSPDGTKIAFASNRDSVYQAAFAPFDVYTMNSDGTGIKRLTNDTGNEGPAGWSPDGSKLLFSREVDGAARLYIMSADGTRQQKLTDYQVYAVHWSPDSSKIFFFGGFEYNDNNVNLFVVNADGSGSTKLSQEGLGHFMAKMVNGHEFLYNIEWSPDNTRIAFVTTSMEDGTDSIYVMNADGASAPTKIADNPGTVFTTVHWSPNGTKIAFVLTDNDGKHGIYLAYADGTGRIRLTTTGSDNFGPIWSPDGRKIAFTSTRDGPERVYIMNAIDGSEQVKLTDGTSTERQFASRWPAAPTQSHPLS